EADRQALPVAKPVLGTPTGLVVAQTPGISWPSIPQAPKPNQIPVVAESAVTPVIEPVGEPQFEAIDQGQPITQMAEPAEKSSEIPAVAEGTVTPLIEPVGEPEFEAIDKRQPIPELPEPAEQTTEPAAADAPRPAPAAHTPVQLTFSFEIVSVQLTPTFKVRTLQVRPASKLVTMRLASSQRPQPQIQPQVVFEIAKIQPTDSGLGTVR